MEYRCDAEQPPAVPDRPPPFTHEDNRRFLQMLREKKERLGVGGEKVEVRFEELSVEAHVRVGRRALPTLLNCTVNAAQVRTTSRPACIALSNKLGLLDVASA
ncbi:hypothetical protein QYE76_032238 [Lolium multiflorum]|uniref:Pleiotropic ABC efflux transporter N-terminal domain-containing protein n=1 Tax=Lolium multiflorum TaxID=4521 RepID=A0AAD8QT41_LOLMU|nr:hypothetical protein QYE76_032238 [Lolium multiflorum]